MGVALARNRPARAAVPSSRPTPCSRRRKEAAVEETFVNRNAGSTLKLGQARGDALLCRGVFFEMMETLQPQGGKPDEFIGIYNSPTWPNDGIQLPVELDEAIHSGKRLFIDYIDSKGQHSERWVTPYQVIGLSDYLYLRAHCHLRNAERTFRLDRVVKVGIEV